MDDLIRRQDAADFLCDWCGICSKEKRNIMECDDIAPNFANIPSVDAVEVVRCKDCKYFDGECCDRYADETLGYSHSTQPNFFCAVGERKTDG